MRIHIRYFFHHFSVLACPGWLRVALMLPLCVLLWCGVLWALYGNLLGDFS